VDDDLAAGEAMSKLGYLLAKEVEDAPVVGRILARPGLEVDVAFPVSDRGDRLLDGAPFALVVR
jgi:hypothetical protein